jgi:hypothetical protein
VDWDKARPAFESLRAEQSEQIKVGGMIATKFHLFCALATICLLPILPSTAAELRVDFSTTNGVIRPLHGGNNGPLGYGEIVDLTVFHRELAIPFTRLHDSAWPYPDIVDIHAVFPDFRADPARPESYRFGPTDDYLRAITNSGSRIVYRLGESIEHAKRKRYVHPPSDPEKWARICEGIIRHCNEGWADGHRMNIRHWEIWNEPENRPAMWTGTPEQYYRLYTVTAKAIKARWPELKVGGPSLGHQGTFENGILTPSAFLRGFLAEIRRERAPLDFFSWHLYTNDPEEPARRARAVRAFLDGHGFTGAESHLNEWNYLPGNDWTPMTSAQGEARERWYARQGGIEGASFAACALVRLQTAPLDMANYYSMDNQPFGLFSLHGTPKKTFHAVKAFRALLETPLLAPATGATEGKSALLAGLNSLRNHARILFVNFNESAAGHTLHVSGLPWQGPTTVEFRVLDDTKDLSLMRTGRWDAPKFVLPLNAPSLAVVLIDFRKANP